MYDRARDANGIHPRGLSRERTHLPAGVGGAKKKAMDPMHALYSLGKPVSEHASRWL